MVPNILVLCIAMNKTALYFYFWFCDQIQKVCDTNYNAKKWENSPKI